MKQNKVLEVYIGDQKVGVLAENATHLVAFEYAESWLEDGYSISPFSLPLRKEVFVPGGYRPFEGLFGVFSDSLPDGWGRLLVDRMLRKNQIRPEEVSTLTRLALVGDGGMGALSYRPSQELKVELEQMNLDDMATECGKLFDDQPSKYLDELYKRGGSSGGARPKANIEIDGEAWIVKFPSSIDRKGIGTEEFKYSICAKKCGISMMETRLLPSNRCDGYFATKRFDRISNQKIHMVTVGGLLELSHRIPSLDYHSLMKLCLLLTKSYEEVEKMYRLMCFNVFAHNRDDHSKNFSFLYRDEHWIMSPAYDLTYSNSIGGEHATTVNGNGNNPGMKDVLEVAKQIKMDMKQAKKIAEEIYDIIQQDLKMYL